MQILFLIEYLKEEILAIIILGVKLRPSKITRQYLLVPLWEWSPQIVVVGV